MKHDEIKDKLFALYDGPLTEKERTLVDGHLTDCRECHQAVAEWKKISNVLFTLPAFSEASEDRLVSSVMEKIQSAPLKFQTPSFKNNLRWLMPLIGSAVAAAWVFFIVLPSTDPAASANVETAFSSSASNASSSGNGIMLASYSSSDELVP
jgi:anti-sigma factor RsiW